MIALICDSWENFWREVLSPWGEIKTFSDGVTLAVSAYQACHFLGMPECNVHLSHAVIYHIL